MNPDEFNEICVCVCPYCRGGHPLRQRADTKEWVHDMKIRNGQQHSICWATGFRNSRFSNEQ
jgi:hypothetical protein